MIVIAMRSVLEINSRARGWFRDPDVKAHRAPKEPYVQNYRRIYPVSLS